MAAADDREIEDDVVLRRAADSDGGLVEGQLLVGRIGPVDDEHGHGNFGRDGRFAQHRTRRGVRRGRLLTRLQRGQQPGQTAVVVGVERDVLPGGEEQRHFGPLDAQRVDAHLPLVLQHDRHLRLLRYPLRVDPGRAENEQEDTALAQAALDGRHPLLARQDAVGGHPDLEAALAQVGGQANGELGIGVGVADEECVGIAGSCFRFGRQVEFGLEEVTVGFGPQLLDNDNEVVDAVVAVSKVDQGADFLAQRHALAQRGADVGKVVKDQVGQLIVAERLNHELAQLRPIDHVKPLRELHYM